MQNNKVKNIFEELKKLSLNDLVDLSNWIAKLYGYTNIKELFDATSGGSASKSEEIEEEEVSKTSDVSLVSFEPASASKIIKGIRDVLGCTLLDAKKHSISLPVVVSKSILNADVEGVIAFWKALGGNVESKPSA